MEPRQDPSVWTYEELQRLPDDGNRYEVIDGELFVTPLPGISHQRAAKHLLYALMRALEDTGLAEVFTAPTDVILSDVRVVIPDLMAISAARRDIISERAVEGPPDLVVEVLSLSTAKTDRTRKRELYARAGVKEYWIVDPRPHRIEVLLLEGWGLPHRRRPRPGAARTLARVPVRDRRGRRVRALKASVLRSRPPDRPGRRSSPRPADQRRGCDSFTASAGHAASVFGRACSRVCRNRSSGQSFLARSSCQSLRARNTVAPS